MRYTCTEERFLNDVKDHELEVIRDNGVHRHLRLKRPGTISYYFDIITWPGHLCITGDCGTYVFQRITDMFDFFFMSYHDFMLNKNEKLSINTGYWAEKVISVDKYGGIQQYSSDLFKENVKEYFDNFFEDSNESEKDKAHVWQELQEDVLRHAEDSEHEAYETIRDFDCAGFEFVDFEYSCQEYTFRYIWNLYAIVYGILKYKRHKATNYIDPETAG